MLMDVYDKAKRSEVMRKVKSRDTGPEMVVRRLLFHAGYRYRLHVKDLPGKPDIVFRGRKKIIFIHGCFWHQHPGCSFASRPSSNEDFWNAKLDRNVVRDSGNIQALTYDGWKVIVIWECELKRHDLLMQRLKDFLDNQPLLA